MYKKGTFYEHNQKGAIMVDLERIENLENLIEKIGLDLAKIILLNLKSFCAGNITELEFKYSIGKEMNLAYAKLWELARIKDATKLSLEPRISFELEQLFKSAKEAIFK